jgi:hypothetical protein
MTTKELAKQLGEKKGRKLSAEELASIKVMPPQFICEGAAPEGMALPDAPARPAGKVGFDLSGAKKRRAS